jgi:hypothetical protein
MSKMRNPAFTVLAVWAAVAVTIPAGCAKFDLHESFVLFQDDPEPQTPARMATVWTHTVRHKAGKPSVRGFGGRVTFHGVDKDEPVLVDGQLTVYAFDSADPDDGDAKPEKKFVFPRENMALHQSESSLGPSYSFWLPWDDIGGQQRQISLIGRFEDASGRVVMSRPAYVTLPGTPVETKVIAQQRELAIRREFPVQAAAYSDETSDPNPATRSEDGEPPPQMTTTTIQVTPGFANRLLAAARESEQTSRTNSESAANDDQKRPPERAAMAEESASENPAGDPPVGSREATTGSAPERFPVRSRPATPPAFDRVRREPYRGASPRRLPPTPRSGWNRLPATSPADYQEP